jgi:hypothetical protein
MRTIVLGLILLLSAACVAVPPAVTIASWAINGISYLASGKSVSDHAISAVLDMDCATWRIIKGDPICVDYPVEETPVMVAASQPPEHVEALEELSVGVLAPGAALDDMTVEKQLVPLETKMAVNAAPAKPGVVLAALSPGKPRPVDLLAARLDTLKASALPIEPVTLSLDGADAETSEKRYVVIGVFANITFATAHVARHSGLRPFILDAVVNGRVRRHVTTGPFTETEVKGALLRAAAQAIEDAWTLSTVE